MVHAANLWHGLVALVHHHQRIGRQVIKQRRRRLPGRSLRQVARVVLNPMAVANLANHLEIEHRPLVQALRFQDLAVAFEVTAALLEFGLDRDDRLAQALAAGDEMRLGKHGRAIVATQRLAGERVERGELIDLVAEQANAQRELFVGGIHLDDVAAHAERTTPELLVVALVLDLDQLAQDLVAVDPLALLERHDQAVVGVRRAQAIDARDAGDDDHVPAFEQRSRGRQAHAIDLLVDRGFLLDVGVAGGQVRLRLVVIVVADEVFDGVVGKEPAELLE